MSDPRYSDGDVVWCKCGGLFWPGEVKALASLPEEIREGFLRTPLVVVKFFDEDGYEFVLNENNIFPYNCPKKTDFIQKGIARYRSKTKEGVTEGWFAKFPKDVVLCEQLTGGNTNILEEPPFAERKEPKVDYSKIFSDPEIEIKKPKSKTPNAKVESKKENTSPNVSSTKSKKKSESSQKTPSTTPKITHPRFLKGGSDHEVRILTQASSPYVFNSDLFASDIVGEKPSALYRCPMCDFAATRVNVVVLHSKSHSQSKVSYAVKPVPKIKTNPAESQSPAIKNKQIKQSAKKVEKSKTFMNTPPPSKKKIKTLSSTPVVEKKVLLKYDSPVSGLKRASQSPAPSKVEKKSTPVPNKKPRLSKKEKEEKERRKEEKVQLLMEWSEDEDEEAEEFKKIQESINQSLAADFSDDEEVDDVFKRDEHHYSQDSDDEQPFTHTTKLDFNRSGSTNSLKTPESAKYQDKKSSPLPNKEHHSSRSSQNSPAGSYEDSPAGTASPSGSSQSSSAGQLSNRAVTASPTRRGASVSRKSSSPAVTSKESPFSKLVKSSSNGQISEKEGNSDCQREKAVQDLFDIDKALQETEVPDVPSLQTFTKFSDFSAFKKKQKLLSKTMSPNKEDENQNTPAEATTDSPAEVDDFDFDNNDDNLFISPLKKVKRTVSPKTVSPKPEQTIDSPSKFSSLSAKAKAKQLARQAAALHTKDLVPHNTDQTPTSDNKDDLIHKHNSNTSTTLDHNSTNVKDDSAFSPVRQLSSNSPSKVPLSPSKYSPSAKCQSLQTPVRNGASCKYDLNEENLGKLILTPATAASLASAVTTLGQLSPAPVMGITQLSSPSTIAAISVGGCGIVSGLGTPGSGGTGLIQPPEGSELEEGGDEQIYYMLVDEGSQLENQTILIDEAQLAAAGGQHGNVIIQQSDGGLIMDTSTRTVYLQDATSGQLVNVVVADDKDVRSPVSLADTSGGVAILPNHPSSSMHSQVPLITTPSGKTPIMISNNPNQQNK